MPVIGAYTTRDKKIREYEDLSGPRTLNQIAVIDTQEVSSLAFHSAISASTHAISVEINRVILW
jgi:hypothetical protein